MSSIAYVTDEKMLEYHRLCRNRDILFWRLSSRKKFTDFRKGDLLFFFARPAHSRRKGLIGYAHFDSVKRLSLRQMWNKFNTSTGYDSMQLLSEAILDVQGKAKLLKKFSGYRLLILDEWLLNDMTESEQHFIFELIERRYSRLG